MMRNIFFPEQLNGYYFFDKRVIGFDIGKTHITATLVLLKGYTCTIEKVITEKIINNAGAEYNESVAEALEKVMSAVGAYDEIRTVLPSSAVVFKELKMPFIGRERIAMTVGFEVEPLLPFPLQDAVIDFIVTREHLEEKSSEILVAAVQKQHIAEHLALFAAARLTPSVVGVDLFSLYGLYSKALATGAHAGNVVLVDLGSYTTTLAYIVDGQLRLVRCLPKGSVYLAKYVSDAIGMPYVQVMETIMRYGLEHTEEPAYVKALVQALNTMWKEVAFTLQSFSVQVSFAHEAPRLLLYGGGAGLKGLPKFVAHTIGNPCDIWDVDMLLHDAGVHGSAKSGVSRSTITSVSAALAYAPVTYFSLLKHEFENQNEIALFDKQFFAACALTLFLVGSLIAVTIADVRSVNREAVASETEARDELKLVLSGLTVSKLDEEGNLDDVVDTAQELVKNEETLWFSFANPARTSFLKYLLELTSRIDRQGLGFTINKLTIADGVMTLDAQVRDHEALKLLEKELRQSKLFVAVEGQEDPSFRSMKIKLTQAG